MNNSVLIFMIGLLCAVLIVLVLKFLKLKSRYGGIIDLDQEILKAQAAFDNETNRFERLSRDHKKKALELNAEYQSAHSLYQRLRHEISSLEETLEDISFGLYRPHYSFEDPEQYKHALDEIYLQKKSLLKNGSALSCPTNWSVNGSTREGTKMIKQESKLMMRAFNGEIDAAIAKVAWNNVTKMEERIQKAFAAINALGSVTHIQITRQYLELAVSEMRLTHELEQRKQAIKEEQREIREQMREEERAQREFERAKKAAEEEAARYEKALEAARAEMLKASASEIERARAKISALEERLAEAQGKLDRAVSMAELTKSGHVYIISNIGSFGDEVFKIGMSRRLEPAERVYELGSASVPFPYDIHAMIYSTDAPALENAFHRQFAERRVNMVNTRKEFFRVGLDEIERFAITHQADIEFTRLAEAREYRETLSLLTKSQAKLIEPAGREKQEFPEGLSLGV